MSDDPPTATNDHPLDISEETIAQLRAFRAEPKFLDFPGVTPEECVRLTGSFDELLDRLIAGVRQNPTKLWALMQFEPTLRNVEDEDTEAREDFAEHLHRVMDILGIESSNGLFGWFL